MFGDLTTVTLTYKRGWDKVYADVKDPATGRIINDPSFGGFDKDGNPISFKDADHRGYSWAQPDPHAQRSSRTSTTKCSPTRATCRTRTARSCYLDSAVQARASRSRNRYTPTPTPATRPRCSSNTICLVPGLRRRLIPLLLRHLGHPRPHGGVGLHPSGVQALDLRRLAALLHAECRELLQRPVSARQFPEFHGARPRARGIQQLHGGLRRLVRLPDSAQPWINKSSFKLHYDHLLIDYRDFRNALLIGPTSGYTAGNEPLYKLNANILQAFFQSGSDSAHADVVTYSPLRTGVI